MILEQCCSHYADPYLSCLPLLTLGIVWCACFFFFLRNQHLTRAALIAFRQRWMPHHFPFHDYETAFEYQVAAAATVGPMRLTYKYPPLIATPQP